MIVCDDMTCSFKPLIMNVYDDMNGYFKALNLTAKMLEEIMTHGSSMAENRNITTDYFNLWNPYNNLLQ